MIPDSSIQHADLLRPIEDRRCWLPQALVLAFFGFLSPVLTAAETVRNEIDFDIARQRADIALTQFAEQADLTLIFPYDVVRKETANRLVGRYSVEDGIVRLLEGTGLQPVFSGEGELTGVARRVSQPEEHRMTTNKKSGVLAALAVFFGGTTAHAQDSATAGTIEEIVVEGVRLSLSRALDRKREAVGVVDAIAAQDLGEFPDQNISESLQRIPGVTITRNLGEGEQVSVRGLAPQFTGVTINGMQAASAAQGDDGNIAYGRALTFDLFPSELFSGATVYKSPTASLQDGGLSATVDMRVPRPFDYGGFEFSTKFQASENDLVEETQPSASLLISNTFADDRVGLLFQAAYAETVLHGELSEGVRFDRTNFDLDGDGTNEYTNVEFARLVRTGVEEYDRERIGFTGALQLRPTDNLEIVLDAMYGETDRERERHTLDGSLFGNGPDSPISLTERDGVIIAGTFANEPRNSENIYNHVDTEFSLYSLSANWAINDSLSVYGKVGFSDASFARDEVRITYAVVDPEFSYDLRGDHRYPITGSGPGVDLTDPSQFTIAQVRHHPFFVDDENVLVQFDIAKQLGDRGFTGISAGAQWRTQERSQAEFREDRNLNDPNYLPLDSPFRRMDGVGGTTLSAIGFDIFSGMGPAGLLRDFAVPDRDAAFAALIDPNFQPAQLLLSTYTVKEEILAGYIKANFSTELAGRPLDGDIGLRYALTDQSSSSFSQSTSGTVPVFHQRDYDNLLPSMNLRWQLTDEFLLRFAASIGMTRPTLSEINPSQNVQLGSQTVTINNPDLEPFKANQFDIVLEWYFADESLLALNFFYKDIESLVTRISNREPFFGENLIFQGVDLSGQEFLVSRLVNGDGATLEGVEFSYQQPFTFLPAPFDGFGILANYTYANSESTVTFGGQTFTAPIEGQSKHSYNIIAYYEKGGFSARAAWHWRDDFLILRLGTHENRFQQDAAYLDFTASYNFSDSFKLSLDASNLTSEDSYRYDRTMDRNIAFANYGRVYSLRALFKL